MVNSNRSKGPDGQLFRKATEWMFPEVSEILVTPLGLEEVQDRVKSVIEQGQFWVGTSRPYVGWVSDTQFDLRYCPMRFGVVPTNVRGHFERTREGTRIRLTCGQSRWPILFFPAVVIVWTYLFIVPAIDRGKMSVRDALLSPEWGFLLIGYLLVVVGHKLNAVSHIRRFRKLFAEPKSVECPARN